MPSELIAKIRRMGLRNALRKAAELCLFGSGRLLWLEREVGQPQEPTPLAHAWTYRQITHELLPAFDLHFARHRKVFRDLVDEPGVQGIAAFDPEGNACAFLWFSDRDYYDRHYYRCWFPVEPGCVYLFAIEVAKAHRGSRLVYGAQDMFWQRMRAAGVQRVQAVVNARNALTLKMLRHVGFRRLDWETRFYTLFGSLRFTFHPEAVRARIQQRGDCRKEFT
jgi:hypothetical protein